MAISGGTEMLKKISSQIESQFPSFIREEGPNFVAFLKAYFEYMEQAGNATDAVRSLEDLHDIDRTVDGFVEYFRREFMVNIPASVLADKRLLTKHIIEFYRSRGSEQSYRFLFRILFDREIDIYYPGNDILRASDGRWVRESKLRVGEPYSKNPRLFDGIEVRGVESGAKGLVQSIIGARASGLMIYDMTVENVFGNFIDGERVVDADGNYVTVNAQIGPLSGIRLIDGGAFHKQGDLIEISGAGSVSPATAVVDRVRSDSAVTIQLVNGGSGYTKENTRVVVDGDGLGFEAVVASFSSEPTVVSLNTDTIRPLANVVLNTGPTFISLGANTSAVSGALAAANLYSTIIAAATFSNSAFYAVNAIALINPGYNHSTLPTITILDDEVGVKFETDGYGGYLGRNATVSVSHAPGTIDELRITNPGVDFNRFEYASLLNTSQGNSVITLSSTGTSASGSPNTKYLSQQTTYSGSAQPEPKGITIFPGRYIDTKGFLSWNNKLQDNYYYQEFSYVIKVSEQLAKYREIVRSLVHPAGAIMFGEYVVRSKADVPPTVAVSRINLFNLLLTENAVALANTLVEISTSHTESVTASELLLASITLPLTETVTSNTAESAQVNFVSSASESITTTSTHSAQVDFVSSASESITTTSTHSAQANFQPIANESFTATDSSTTQTVFQSFANDAILTVSTAQIGERFVLMSGYYQVQYANDVIQAYQSAQIQPYAAITSGSLDGTARLVTNTTSGSFFSNGAISANAGSINVGGPGSNLFIVTVGDTLDPNAIYQVNAIFSNTSLTLRTEYLPVTSNAQIYYSTGPG
jgi:hypothetical protein